MTIPTKELTKWIALYAHGDYMAIAADYIYINQRVSLQNARKQVQEAFKKGECRDNLYPVIKKYYEKIESQLKHVKWQKI